MSRATATAAKKTVPQIADPRWPRTCILVADTGAARLLRAYRAGATRGAAARGPIQLEEVARLENPVAHLPARSLTSDRTGRVFDSGGRTGHGPRTRARHGAQSDYDPHEVEVERFARRLARRLDAERRDGIEEMIVIAGPRLLGVLRQQLTAATRRLIAREIDHDLVHADAQLIRRAAFPRVR